jgi:hypothetical protein
VLEVGKVYRGVWEKAMMCVVLEVAYGKSWHGHPPPAEHYLLLWLTTSGNPDARDEAGKTEWEVARLAENYLEEA